MFRRQRTSLFIITAAILVGLGSAIFLFYTASRDHAAQAAEHWPQLIRATIDPPDVHVGDIQRLEVIVQDPRPIVSVEARIETDRGVKIVPLQFQRIISDFEILPSSYYPKLRYAAKWNVVDTHDAKYQTTFVVKDAAGREESATVAWSDACAIPNSGNWSLSTYGSDCGILSTDGVDAGNATVDIYRLTLNSTFAFNAGKSITISSGGRITIGSGGQIVQTNLWKPDSDVDGYPGSTPQVAQTSQPAGTSPLYVRKSLNLDDCDDSNAFIYTNRSDAGNACLGDATTTAATYACGGGTCITTCTFYRQSTAQYCAASTNNNAACSSFKPAGCSSS